MPYEISQDGSNELIYLRFLGGSSHQEHLDSRVEAIELCRGTGYKRLVVDTSKEEPMMPGSTLDLYEFGKNFTTGDFPAGLKIAVVDEEGVKPDIEFVTNVMRNRGFLVELFNNADEAVEWLKK